MDIVGPLPKADRGSLVLMDYATFYPEGVALHSTTAPVVACELSTVFSWLGFLRLISTDKVGGEVQQDS